LRIVTPDSRGAIAAHEWTGAIVAAPATVVNADR